MELILNMDKKISWCFGANFTPSNAINQLEMWQKETFSPDVIDRELGWAEGIGMTLMRVYLHDLAYAQDKGGFLSRIETYLEIAARHGIRTGFVFFDDCWLPNPKAGKQPEPKPFTHNSGWVQSPGEEALGKAEEYPRLKEYMQTVLKRFGNDERIAFWDLYNEPHPFPRQETTTDEPQGNPLLPLAFEWAREAAPSQPLTVSVWTWHPAYTKLNRIALEQSDIVSFHCYGVPQVMSIQAEIFRFLANGRPVICTEYMARTNGSTFKECLPILKKNGISAINWGLVAGKTNTIYPYGWSEENGIPPLWFHDVFNVDGTMLYPEEKKVLQEIINN